MNLDLSALDDTPEAPGATQSNGKPLRAPLDRFYPDPDQPRKEFEPSKMKKFAAELKKRGVMNAVIVAPPDSDDRMRIIQGERRYRGAILAELADLPYFIADDLTIYDDYSQVAENEQREGLSPMELATFIAKRIKLGDQKQFIAQNLNIDNSDVTHLLTLIEGPDFIKALYFENKCRTPKYLYELAKLAKSYPVEVELFCGESDDFSRKAINALTDDLIKPQSKAPEESTKLDLDRPMTGGGNGGGAGAGSGGGTGNDIEPEPALPGKSSPAAPQTEDTAAGATPPVSQIPSHNPANEEAEAKALKGGDPLKMKKPLLLAMYKGRDVMVLLFTRPTTPGLAHIKFSDGSGQEEVALSDLQNLTLVEATV